MTDTTIAAAPVAAPQQAQTAPAIPTGQPQGERLTPQGQQIANLLSVAETNPKILEGKPELKELAAKIKASKGQKTTTPAASKTSAAIKTEAELQAEDAAKANQPEENDSIFFKKEIVPIDALDLEGFAKKLGQKDANTLYNSVNQWRGDSEKLKSVSREKDEIQDFIAKLPEDVMAIVKDFYDGKDYTERFQQSGVNFNIPFEKQTEKVTKHYFPAFSEDDLLLDDAIMGKYKELAKVQFGLDKQQKEQQSANARQMQAQRQRDIANSAESSLQQFREAFPGFSDTETRNVAKIMKSGDANSLFMKNGIWTEDAAKMIAMALYAEKEINSKVGSAKKAAKNEVLMDEIDKGAQKPAGYNAQPSAQTPVSDFFTMVKPATNPYAPKQA